MYFELAVRKSQSCFEVVIDIIYVPCIDPYPVGIHIVLSHNTKEKTLLKFLFLNSYDVNIWIVKGIVTTAKNATFTEQVKDDIKKIQ